MKNVNIVELIEEVEEFDLFYNTIECDFDFVFVDENDEDWSDRTFSKEFIEMYKKHGDRKDLVHLLKEV